MCKPNAQRDYGIQNMHRLKLNVIIWFVFGLLINATDGEHLQWLNDTGTQSIRTRERQHQSQYQYGSTKPANKQQLNRGRSNGLNELRKNLTAQKLYERQGDDPDQNSVNLSPIHQIHQRIQQSDVSKIKSNAIQIVSNRIHFIMDYCP